MAAKQKAAIVIVNYASSELIAANYGLIKTPIFVVDNFKTAEDSASMAKLAKRHGWVLVTSENLGFGVGCNLGAQVALEAGFQVALFMNPDVSASQASIDALIAAVAPKKIVAPTILNGASKVWFRGGVLDEKTCTARHLHAHETQGSDWLTAACIGIRLADFFELGGFAGDYFMYWEDVELTYRAKQSGFELAVLPEVTVGHDVGGTQSEGAKPKSLLYVYYNARNRMLFAKANLSTALRLRWWLKSYTYYKALKKRYGLEHFKADRADFNSAFFRGLKDSRASSLDRL